MLINKEVINLGDVVRSLSGSKPTGTQRISNNFLSFCNLEIVNRRTHNVFSLIILRETSHWDVGADLILFQFISLQQIMITNDLNIAP